MTKELDILIDGIELYCLVKFDYFKEDGEVTINILSIKCNKIDVLKLVSSADMEHIKWKCQEHYENTSFEYWEQRYEERNSGLLREL